MLGPRPRCEEAAPPPSPPPPNLLLAQQRHWISWREGACTALTQGTASAAPPCPYKTPTTAAIREPARLDGLRRPRPDLLRAGKGPDLLENMSPAAASQLLPREQGWKTTPPTAQASLQALGIPHPWGCSEDAHHEQGWSLTPRPGGCPHFQLTHTLNLWGARTPALEGDGGGCTLVRSPQRARCPQQAGEDASRAALISLRGQGCPGERDSVPTVPRARPQQHVWGTGGKPGARAGRGAAGSCPVGTAAWGWGPC